MAYFYQCMTDCNGYFVRKGNWKQFVEGDTHMIGAF